MNIPIGKLLSKSESRMRRSIAERKLLKLLSLSDDAEFFQMLWAVYILQSDNPKPARRYLEAPDEVLASGKTDAHRVQHWELDTLATLVLTTRKARRDRKRTRTLRHDQWSVVSEVVNQLRDLENAESGIATGAENILQEMARVAQRQFHWHRSYYHPEGIRRALYVYGHDAAKSHFEAKYGVSLDDFTMTCIILSFEWRRTPWLRGSTYQDIAMKPGLFENVMNIVSLDVERMRREAQYLRSESVRMIGGVWRYAYLPSALRRYPVLKSEHGYIAPIPNLLIYRCTAGLYYDFIGSGDKGILAASEKRFEQYVVELLPAYLPGTEALPEIEIGAKKARFLTPDVLLKSEGRVTVVFECKGAKNPYAAQFAADLIEGGRRGTEQLCKGVVQLWRFFSAVRRGVYAENPVAPEARAVLVTLDSWLLFDTHVKADIIARAHVLAARHPEIQDGDRRPIRFCTAQDLADTLQEVDEGGFYAALDASTSEPKYAGWDLIGVLRDIGRNIPPKPFPFNMDEVIPWRATLPDN